MPKYALEIAKSVEKDLRKIPFNMHDTLFNEIEKLTINPFPESRYKKLQGTSNSYRLRVGNYRKWKRGQSLHCRNYACGIVSCCLN